MEKKNTMLLTVIAVATLLVAVVGATFAYFNVTGSAGSSTTAVTAETQSVGTVTLAAKDTLHINLSAADMSQTAAGDNGATYYFTSVANADKADSESNGTATLATATIKGGEANIKYYCTATVSVAATSDLAAAGIAELTLIENDNIKFDGSSDGKKVIDLYTGAVTGDSPTTFTAKFSLTSTAAAASEEANATGDVFNLNGFAVYKNLTTAQAQADISTNLILSSFDCNSVDDFPS